MVIISCISVLKVNKLPDFISDFLPFLKIVTFFPGHGFTILHSDPLCERISRMDTIKSMLYS